MWDFLKKPDATSLNDTLETVEEFGNVKVIKDLKTYGFQMASSSHASIPVLKANISKLYHNKIIDDENFFKKEEERKVQVKNRLNEELDAVSKLDNEISLKQHECSQTEKEITELKNKKEKINAGDKAILGEIQPPDRIGYNIGLFILLFLTTYLFLFYSSAIYNSFVYDVKDASRASILHNTSIATTIFNPNAIVDAYNKSLFTFLFIITSPMIFLGLGYLIHKFNEKKKYLYTTLILLFTFLFDAVLAYAIVSEIYEAKYVTGMSGIDKPWEFNMIYSQVPFYIILAAGFVIYIVWGVVLSFVIYGHNNLNPIRSALNTINNQIKDLKKKLAELTEKISQLQNEKSIHQTNTKKLEAELKYEKFNEQVFLHKVAEFMNGWHNWIVQGLPYEKHVRQQEADTAKDEIIELLYKQNLLKNENA